MKKKLYRNQSDKKLFGVCGGLADYFEIDATIIRIIWIITAFFWGTGILCYLICAVAMPIKKEDPIEYEYIHKKEEDSN